MNSAIALCLIDASDASSGRQYPSAAGNKNAAATEAVVSGLSIDQHDVS
jgi:hypothetical protein